MSIIINSVKFKWNTKNVYFNQKTYQQFIEILMQETLENFKNPVNSPINYSPNFIAMIEWKESGKLHSQVQQIPVNLSYEFVGKRTKEQNNIVCRFTTPDGILHEQRMTIKAITNAMNRKGDLIKLVTGFKSNSKQGRIIMETRIKSFLMDSFK